MNILVPIKRAVDYKVRVRIKPDNSGVELDNVQVAMEPFSEIALEQAILFKEAGAVQSVIAVAVGSANANEQLRSALALGADQAILVESDVMPQPLDIARVLVALVKELQISLVLCGKQSIDTDNNQVPQMVAGLLNWPQATYAASAQLEQNQIRVVREVDGGNQTLLLDLPAVVSADLRLNTPRFASLMNIMKAKKKPLISKNLSDYLPSRQQSQCQYRVDKPKARQAGIKLDNLDELLAKLAADGHELS